jgi:hypothetical protein
VEETNSTDLRDIVCELAQAQGHTEARVEELAQAQLRTENEVTHLRRTVETQLDGLGARWGIQTEEAFRNARKTILEAAGFAALLRERVAAGGHGAAGDSYR